MEIRLIDRARNVTMVPKPPYVAAMRGVSGNPFLALDDLLNRAGDVSQGQHEFECDGEFMDDALAWSEANEPMMAKPDVPWKRGHEATYHGVPIIVDRPAKEAGAEA